MKYNNYKYEYITNNDNPKKITITEYIGDETELIIPSEIDGIPVTSIGYWAFTYCNNLTNIVIPDSVASIGDSAFSKCRSLTSIVIPNSVTSISDWVFYNCSSLTSVTIPDSVISIGEGAFKDCTNLTSIVIPDRVTSIGDCAFSYCNSLSSVTIPNSVTSIGDEAFSYCTNLTSVTIPNSITSIGDGTFSYCNSLRSIVIPNSVTSIGDYAFKNCSNLKSSVNSYKAFNIRNNELYCRNYKFTEDMWTDEINNPILCRQGYHFCTNLFEIFNYYWGELDEDIAIYECEVGDTVIKENGTSKCVTNKIKPVKRLYREDIIRLLNLKD